jgi:ubiquinone/menaquinone biosynthesis C-methylase UbiE
MSPEKEAPGNRDQLARVYSEQTWRLYDFLDQSLVPRGPDSLHEVASEHLTAGSMILDAGCRDAEHLIRLVQAHDASGVGIDPVNVHIERAKAAVAAAGLSERIEVVVGVVQELPYPDGHFDFVWCRDVVEQIDALDAALSELARVLEPDGRMLIYTVFATNRLEPREAEMLNRHLGNVAANLIESHVEDAFENAGLAVERKDVVGTEWREYAEERTRPASRALLKLSRLRRLRNTVVERYGQDVYDHVEANLHWEAYQLLGKLQPTLYVLSRQPGG